MKKCQNIQIKIQVDNHRENQIIINKFQFYH